MATRRKRFTPPTPLRKDRNLYAAFIAALLAGTVTADKLIETRAKRRLVLSYDDPNG